MTWTVTSDLMRWPAGSELAAADLKGLDIDGLIAGGHLTGPAAPPDGPRVVVPETTATRLTGAALAAALGGV